MKTGSEKMGGVMESLEWVVLLVILWTVWQFDKTSKAAAENRQFLSEDMGEMVRWLKEIDPRFDLEHGIEEDALDPDCMREKIERGERTFKDPLRRRWRKKQKELEEEEWRREKS